MSTTTTDVLDRRTRDPCHPIVHPNDTAVELIGRPYLSYSSISAYQACPLRFFFRYVANLPEETVSASLAFGGAIHAALEHHYRELLAGNPTPKFYEIWDAFWNAWLEKSNLPISFGANEDLSSITSLAQRTLAAFQQSEFSQPTGRILGIEEELRGQLVPGVPDLLAKIDLIVEERDALVVTDFKTSRSRWNEDKVDESAEQLLLYSELARELAPGKELRLEFLVIAKTKNVAIDRHEVEYDPQRVERTKRVVERVWRAIEAGHFYPAPSLLNCSGCPYREPCRTWRG